MLAAAGVATLAGATIVAFGPGAAWLVDHIADGRKVWRLGRLEASGVSGPHLGALTIERLSLRDEDGIWATAENVSLRWRPFAILSGEVLLDRIVARRLHVLRRPALSAPSDSTGPNFDVVLTALNVGRIDLEAPVADMPAALALDLGLVVRDERLAALALDLTRLDAPLDRANAQFSDDGARIVLAAEVRGAPGGLFAHVIGADDRSFELDATLGGDARAGEGILVARIDEERFLNASLGWEEARWRMQGAAVLEAAPILAPFADRIGEEALFSGEGARAGAFSLSLDAPNLDATLAGVEGENFTFAEARLEAETNSLERLAPEIAIGAGAARLDGALTRTKAEIRYEGEVSASSLRVAGLETALAGAARVQFNDDALSVRADLTTPERTSPLLSNAALKLNLHFDRARGRVTIRQADLDGDTIAANAQGWANGETGELSGEWRVKRMQALTAELRGDARGRWRLRQTPRDGWTGALNGAARNVSGSPEAIPQLLGRAPSLDASFAFKDGDFALTHARLNGANLRAGASGRIRDGALALVVEASARGPVDLGGARLDGAADATGNITGSVDRPRLSLAARLASLDAGGLVFETPRLELMLASDGRAYQGALRAEALVSGQAARAEAQIALADGALAFNDLEADLAALHAKGNASFSAAGPRADLILTGRLDGLFNGIAGRIDGEAALTPETANVRADLREARFGALRVRNGAISARGPYENLDTRLRVRGAIGRAALAFRGVGALDVRDGFSATMDGEGALAGAPIAFVAPAQLKLSNGVLEASIDAQFESGRVEARWRERGGALSGAATLSEAPIAPLAAIWGERASGRASGEANLQNVGRRLQGGARLDVRDARFSQRTPEALNGALTISLADEKLEARLEAQSSDGLTANVSAQAPVTTSTAPIRVALAPNRRGEAAWSVRGPVSGLWAAARLPDQALSGAVAGEGRIEFGAGALSGAGGIALSGGAFEDKISGVKLEAIDAAVRFGPDGARITRFSASDGRGGAMTARGGAADPTRGEIAINLDDLRLVDRPDARATASGDLTLAWADGRSHLSGALAISEGEISIAQGPGASVPQLDVIEINRPGAEEEDYETRARAPAVGAATLDIRVRAPGRIFTRGRGLEAEWSLDLRVAGDVAQPRLFGEARAVRGSISLSGRPFDIESGIIAFNGDPLEARIDLAAERRTNDLTARIRLSGTANDPEIAFESDPSLPEDEILPQILFGRSVEDLTAIEAAQLAGGLAALSGQSSFDLAETARALSGLDRLDVREDEDGGFLVAGGVYLTRDVYLEVARTGLGQASTSVEWRLRPRLLLITSFLPNGDQRASIRWRRESD